MRSGDQGKGECGREGRETGGGSATGQGGGSGSILRGDPGSIRGEKQRDDIRKGGRKKIAGCGGTGGEEGSAGRGRRETGTGTYVHQRSAPGGGGIPGIPGSRGSREKGEKTSGAERGRKAVRKTP